MASIRRWRSACAAASVFVSTAAAAQVAPPPSLSSAATIWHLRSGLNVAALACPGAGEAALVAGYNRLLADRRAELNAAYNAVQREYRSAAAYDGAMTRLYNGYAQPAQQAVLCENALSVLDQLAAAGDAPLDQMAAAALVRLETPAWPTTQLAVAAIPHILDQRETPAPAGE